jgi:hypothetical protein
MAKLTALMTDDRLDDEIAWIKAEATALHRDSAALGASRAAIARCRAAMDCRDDRPEDRPTLY